MLNNNGDFYRLTYFHSFRTKNKLETHKILSENHNSCHLEMPKQDNNIVKYNL